MIFRCWRWMLDQCRERSARSDVEDGVDQTRGTRQQTSEGERQVGHRDLGEERVQLDRRWKVKVNMEEVHVEEVHVVDGWGESRLKLWSRDWRERRDR